MQSQAWNNISIDQIKKNILKNQIPTTSISDKISEVKDGFHNLTNPDHHDSGDDDLTTPWICWSCTRVFQFKCLLFKHQLHCNVSRGRKQSIQKHYRKILSRKISPSMKHESITCPICHVKFVSRLQYKSHRQQGPCSKKCLSCIDCHQKFKSFQELRSHHCFTHENSSVPLTSTPRHDRSRIFSCKCCKSSFDLPESLKTHLLENSVCSKMHHLHIKMECKKRQLEFKGTKRSLTARKSFPNSTSKFNEETTSPSSSMSIDLDRSFPSPAIGSARKSFPSASQKVQENHLCNTCGKRFLSSLDLKFHEEQHLQDRNKQILSQCPICQEAFSDSHELFQHQADFDHYSQGPKPFGFSCTCPFCDKKFLHIQNRNAHLRYHTEKTSSEIKEYVRKTTCGVCFRIFGNENAKEQHIRLAHIQMPISSPIVKNFQSPSNMSLLQNSVKKESDDSPTLVILSKVSDLILKQLRNSPTICPVCCRTYDSNVMRNRHFRLHVMDASCECEICFLKFPLTSYLETHMKSEHKSKVAYDCKHCGISFFTRIAVLQHVMKKHPLYSMTDLIEEKKSNIKVMNFNDLLIKSEVKSENNAVKGEFQCNLCNIKFLKLCGLRRHQSSRIHAKSVEVQLARQEKVKTLQLQLPPRAVTPPYIDYSNPITCTECAVEFPNVQKFVPHRLNHFSGEKEIILTDKSSPYTCEVCGKLIDNQQKIQIHLIWHLQDVQTKSSNKTFKARKSFSSTKNISSSSMSNPKSATGGAVAKKSFKSNSQHTFISAKKSSLTCKKCFTNFTSKYDYLLHMKRVHTNVQNISEDSNSASQNFAMNCLKCDKFFDEEALFYNHQKSCNEKSYCVSCGCFFSTSTLFDEHKTLFCTPGFKVRIDENFISKNLHVLSNSIKTDVVIISCIQCCTMFDTMEMLAKHMKNHKITPTTNGSISSSIDASSESDSGNMSSNYCKENTKDLRQNVKSSPKITDNENSQLCKITNINTIDPNEFAMENSGDSYNLPSDENDNTFGEQSNFTASSSFELTKLRQHFSRLLNVLVSDADLMEKLGFGERLIDNVLINILEKMALTPVDENDSSLSALDKLRCNIRTLLDVCIKEKVMEFITNSEITTDKIVIAALKMFGIEVE